MENNCIHEKQRRSNIEEVPTDDNGILGHISVFASSGQLGNTPSLHGSITQLGTSALLEVWPARQHLSLVVSSGQLGNRHLPSPAQHLSLA
jgi:hypothetical protein